jgi:hypothetical protein
MVLEAGKSKIEGSASGKGLLASSAHIWRSERKRDREGARGKPFKLISIINTLLHNEDWQPSWPHHFLTVRFLNFVTMRIKFQHESFWGTLKP